MTAFSLLNPALLWLLPLAAIPIIIHLLNRRRFQRVRWAAMTFLLAALKRNRRRLQMQEWLLLLLRTLAVLLVVFLVSRPQAESAFGVSRAHHVVCLDDSLSMAQRSGVKDIDGAARERLLATVAKLAQDRTGDMFSLVVASRPERPLLAAARVGPQLPGRVRELLDQAPRSDRRADLAAVLARAETLAAEHTDADRTEVLWITDGRQADWLAADGRPHPDLVARLLALDAGDTELRVIALAGRDAENLAVSEVRRLGRFVAVGVPITFEIDVRNFGLAASAANELVVRIGRGDRFAQTTRPLPPIAPGERATVTVLHTFAEAGDHGIVAAVGGDAYPPDDQRSLVVTVREAARCLLVDGDPGQLAEDSETFFLATVLDPQLEVVTGVEPIVVTDTALADQVRSRDGLADIDMVWLCNVPPPAKAVAEGLRAFVDGGGGLVIFAGNQLDPVRYNELLGPAGVDLLPVPFTELGGDVDAPVGMVLADPEHPLVAAEAESLRGLIPEVLLKRWLALADPGGGTAQPILRAGDARGPSIMAAAPVGERGGRVVQIGFTADDYWTSLPRFNGAAFAILTHEICAWGVRAANETGKNLGVDEVRRIRLDLGRYRPDVTVRSLGDATDARTFTAAATGSEQPPPDGSAAPVELPIPMGDLAGFGLFELTRTRHTGDQDVELLARNPPLHESEMLRISAAGLQQALPPEAMRRVTLEQADAASAEPERGSGLLARALAVALLVGLLLESILAFRSSR